MSDGVISKQEAGRRLKQFYLRHDYPYPSDPNRTNLDLVREIALYAIRGAHTLEEVTALVRSERFCWVVAHATVEKTRSKFSWQSVCTVIERSGDAGVSKSALDRFAADHPIVKAEIRYNSNLYGSSTVKGCTTVMAKAILCLETFLFLKEEFESK